MISGPRLRSTGARRRQKARALFARADALLAQARRHKSLGHFSQAGPCYQRALHIVERLRGPDHVEVASLYFELGSLEHAAGNGARGEPFARAALRIRERAVGRRHPLVAHDMIGLAALLDQQKKYIEAELLYTRALAILGRAHDTDHDDEAAIAFNNLALIHQARGRPMKAQQCFLRAIALEAARFGSDHPRVAVPMQNLSVLLDARGRREEAAALFVSALAIVRRANGPQHPSVGHCLQHYARILHAIGQSRAALALQRRANRVLGRGDVFAHSRVVTATVNPECASFRLVVGPSAINRFGVFADEAIDSGQRVIEYTGERVGRHEARRRCDPARSYLFKLDAYWHLDGAVGGSGAEYVNHSCAPNLAARKWRNRIIFYSCRRIASGEELTIDYKLPSETMRLECRCGAATCRGTMNVSRRG